jgi:hypothetical protein
LHKRRVPQRSHPGSCTRPGDLDAELKKCPITDSDTFQRAQQLAADLRVRHPLVGTESVDVVVSNYVLNLVESDDKRQLFQEIFRVLRKGGRAVISDIVRDEDVPEAMQQDPTHRSGCISGALREDQFLKAFEDAGFHGIRLLKRDVAPWQTVQGIEFRSVTVEAFKGKQGECWELNQAVIYRGPPKPRNAATQAAEGVTDVAARAFKQPPSAFQFAESLSSNSASSAVIRQISSAPFEIQDQQGMLKTSPLQRQHFRPSRACAAVPARMHSELEFYWADAQRLRPAQCAFERELRILVRNQKHQVLHDLI